MKNLKYCLNRVICMRKQTIEVYNYTNLHGRERQKMKCREYHALHREEQNAKRKALWEKHREEHKLKCKINYEKNKSDRLQKQREDYVLNPKKYNMRSIAYRASHLEQERLRGRRRRLRVKIEAFSKITNGGPIQCCHCGCDKFEFLEINHKNGGGRKEQKLLETKTVLQDRVQRELRSVEDLEITCRVCNALHYLKLKDPEHASNFNVKWN